MGTVWLKNFLGLKQSDFELLKMPNPRLEYGLQITLRTTEIGTLIGSFVGPLLTFLWNERRPSDADIKQSFTQGGLTGAIIGCIAGSLYTFYKLGQMNQLQLYDRCYRHRFDTSELNIDRACFLGATLGSVGCGAYGYAVGVDAAFLISKVLMKRWNK